MASGATNRLSPRPSPSVDVSPTNSFTFSFQPDASLTPDPPRSEGPSYGSPAVVDKFAHTRCKRKRTSREDFAVLESEYQRNSRPDKATRIEIVERVSLSEKEIQIWFQNRRQMTRRKCRTWQPNEITSIIRSSQDIIGESESAENLDESSQLIQSQSSEFDTLPSQESTNTNISTQSSREAGQRGTNRPDAALNSNVAGEGTFALENETDKEGTPPDVPTVLPESQIKQLKENLPEKHRALVDKSTPVVREAAGSLNSTHKAATYVEGAVLTADKTSVSKPLKRSSSSFRLSTSLDGKAQVVKDGSTPSPPKKKRPNPLQRSQSVITPATSVYPEAKGSLPAWRNQRAHGRSRDARTWEFYCDSDARNALTKSAEHEQKGSALGVIALIRSGSGSRKPLTPLIKQNSQSEKLESQNRQKPTLGRTISSVARLQTTTESDGQEPLEAKEHPNSSKFELWQEPGNSDSDKENFDPNKLNRIIRSREAARSPKHQQTRFGASPRRALQENTSIMSHASSLGAMMEKDRLSSVRKQRRAAMASQDKENQGSVQVDEEVLSFMGGNDVPTSPSSKKSTEREIDEMDAVQNLLSLSQGAWR